LEEEDLPVRNTRFYARGRFEQKANEAGIPLSAVPAANEASTVLFLRLNAVNEKDSEFVESSSPEYQDQSRCS